MNIREFFLSTTRRVENALSFCLDGINDRILIPNRYVFTSKISVFTWVRANSQSFGVIASHWEEALNQCSWRMAIKGNKLCVQMSVDGTPTNIKDYETSSPIFTIDEWFLVGFVFDSGVLSLFINGLPAGITANSDPVMSVVFPSAPDLLLGASNPSIPSKFFHGRMDDVALYSGSLSPPQALEMWNDGRVVDLLDLSSATDLKSWWRADDAEDMFPVIVDAKEFNYARARGMTKDSLVEDIP